jgi:hypothetical protein
MLERQDSTNSVESFASSIKSSPSQTFDYGGFIEAIHDDTDNGWQNDSDEEDDSDSSRGHVSSSQNHREQTQLGEMWAEEDRAVESHFDKLAQAKAVERQQVEPPASRIPVRSSPRVNHVARGLHPSESPRTPAAKQRLRPDPAVRKTPQVALLKQQVGHFILKFFHSRPLTMLTVPLSSLH